MPKALTDEQNAHVRRLLQRLKEGGMSQAEIGAILGVKQASVSRMLKDGGVQLVTAQRLGRYLGIELEPMLRGEQVTRTTVRALDGYDRARAELSGSGLYTDAVLDAATRVLDAVHANVISSGILEEAAQFAQRFMPRTQPVGKAAEIIGAMKAEREPARKQRAGR